MNTRPPTDDDVWKAGDPLWDLLGQAPRHEPSPWLPSHILRAVRCQNKSLRHSKFDRFLLQLRMHWAMALIILCFALPPLALWRENSSKAEVQMTAYFETFDAVEADADNEEVAWLLAAY